MQQIGDYTVLGVLGEGGMATVYAAEERLSKQQVALKVMQPGLGPSPRLREQFLREMAILGRIDHPNVVRLLSSMEIDGQLVMVLEIVNGETLRSVLRRLGRFAWPDAVHLVRQILAGLSAAHGQQPPIVHRDLKPENVMVAGDGTVKVMDFGIAKVLRDGTRATTDVGTLQYMCPEQIEGVAIDPRGDLYNIGLLLYEMLTGAPPFRSQSTRELLNAQCTEPPPPIAPELVHTLPPALLHLMLRLLAKAPNERPSSALTVLSQLDALVVGGAATQSTGSPTIHSTGPSVVPWPSPVAPASRGPHPGALLAGLLAFLSLAGLVGWTMSRSTSADTPSGGESSPSVASASSDPTVPKIGAVACTVEGRHPEVLDIVVLLLNARPTIAWLDGSTGETYRTLETETERVFCIAPHVLGIPNEDGTKLEMLDAQSGEPLATVTAELGLDSLTRSAGELRIGESDGSHRVHPIPGCKQRTCDFPSERVAYGKVFRDPEVPGFTAAVSVGALCVSDREEIRHGGVLYTLRNTDGFALITAERDETRLWAKRIPVGDDGYLMRCAFQVDAHAVALLRSNSEAGDLEIVRLDPTDGSVIEEASIGNFGETKIAAPAFFSTGSLLVTHSLASKELVAYDPASHEITWRR